MKRNLQTLAVLTKAFTKRYFRDKIALFFTFLFPLLFLLIFGTIFGRNEGPSFDVVLINKSSSQFSKQFTEQLTKSEVFKLKEGVDFEQAKQQLGRSEIDGIIELPENFGEVKGTVPSGTVVAYYDQADEQLAVAFQAILQGMLDGINSQFVTVDLPLKQEVKPLSTANLTRFDYTLAGLIGFSILSLGIFSMSEGFTGDKKMGALRRIKVAPIKPWHLIVATAINRILVGLISVAILFVAALLIFNFNMRGDYLSFAVFTIIATSCMFGFGMAIAGWARDANQAAPLTQILTLPMMFLSGVFFPTFLMPEWLQQITTFIPLTPIIDGLRLILTEGKTILELGEQLAIIGGWTAIIYLIAFRVFRWD